MKIKLIKAFTKDKNNGNPAGVVPDADKLTEKDMPKISSGLGFSESAFVMKSEKADHKIRFFSPTQEVDICGHATIAVFHCLIESGRIRFEDYGEKTFTMETKNGVFPVTCHKDGLVEIVQDKAQYNDVAVGKREIAKMLNIKEADIMKHPLQIVSVGTPKLMISLVSIDALFSIMPDLEGIRRCCEKIGAKGFYPFCFETIDKDSDFHARQFNPLFGIDEDPVTGVAAGALGAYIVHNKISVKRKFIVEQGYVMKKMGRVYVDVADDEVRIGGYAVTFGEKDCD